MWNPGKMVPVLPGMPEGPGPHPKSCDIDYAQSREWGPQGCSSQFQERQIFQNQAQMAHEG